MRSLSKKVGTLLYHGADDDDNTDDDHHHEQWMRNCVNIWHFEPFCAATFHFIIYCIFCVTFHISHLCHISHFTFFVTFHIFVTFHRLYCHIFCPATTFLNENFINEMLWKTFEDDLMGPFFLVGEAERGLSWKGGEAPLRRTFVR